MDRFLVRIGLGAYNEVMKVSQGPFGVLKEQLRLSVEHSGKNSVFITKITKAHSAACRMFLSVSCPAIVIQKTHRAPFASKNPALYTSLPLDGASKSTSLLPSIVHVFSYIEKKGTHRF